MAILVNPTLSEIKERTSLVTPEMINPRYAITALNPTPTPAEAVAAYEADLEGRILEQGYVVEEQLLTRFTEAEIEDFSASTQAVVELVKELLTAADIWDSAGSPGSREQEESERLEARATKLLNAVLNKPETEGDSGGGAQILTLTVGEDFPDEDDV